MQQNENLRLILRIHKVGTESTEHRAGEPAWEGLRGRACAGAMRELGKARFGVKNEGSRPKV
jgi:hypothetical protein